MLRAIWRTYLSYRRLGPWNDQFARRPRKRFVLARIDGNSSIAYGYSRSTRHHSTAGRVGPDSPTSPTAVPTPSSGQLVEVIPYVV